MFAVGCLILAAKGAKKADGVSEVMNDVTESVKDKTDETVGWFQDWWGSAQGQIVDFIVSLVCAILILVIGKKIIKWVIKFLKHSFDRSSMDEAVSRFLLSVIKIGLNIILLVAILGILGIPTSSFVALIGSAGLAIGLALQGSLANFAGGVLILLLKPFRLGDYIVAMGNEGVVTKIDIFYTHLLTVDNRTVVVPNGALSNASVVNVTNEPERRLDLTIGIDYSEDYSRVQKLIREIAAKEQRLLPNREVEVFINSFDASSVSIGIRMWLKKEDYWAVKFDFQEMLKKEFDANQIAIPFNQLDVTIKKD